MGVRGLPAQLDEVMSDLAGLLNLVWPAIVGGVAAGLLVIGVQRLGQWWIDTRIFWPFKQIIMGYKPPPVPTGWDVKLRIFNRTSLEVHFMPTLKRDGQLRDQPWNIYDPWTGAPLSDIFAVAPRTWREVSFSIVRTATANDPPSQLWLKAFLFREEEARTHEPFKLEYDYEFI